MVISTAYRESDVRSPCCRRKHALTLQLQTAHIMSTHDALDQKDKAIQDIKEQKNKLDSERTRLLNCLAEINADRDKVDMLEVSIQRECTELRQKITTLEEGEYKTAKADVDRLRQELGQPPLPPLQTLLDERSSQYLQERRVNGEKRPAEDVVLLEASASSTSHPQVPGKRPRGRPKGSKNRGGKAGASVASASGLAASAAGTGA